MQSNWPISWFLAGGIVFLIECALKYAAYMNRSEFELINIANEFSLNVVYVENRHSAFGMMRAVPDYINHGLLYMSVLFLIGLTLHTVWSSESTKLMRKGILCFLVGASGNMIDRILIGAVVDYIDFRLGPDGSVYMLAWNISDLVINLGFFYVLKDAFSSKDKNKID